jgi:hypothetical protein
VAGQEARHQLEPPGTPGESEVQHKNRVSGRHPMLQDVERTQVTVEDPLFR